MLGITVRTNARHARLLAAILSPTRSFVPISRGVYYLEATNLVQAVRDYDYLVAQRLVAPKGITLHDNT